MYHLKWVQFGVQNNSGAINNAINNDAGTTNINRSSAQSL